MYFFLLIAAIVLLGSPFIFIAPVVAMLLMLIYTIPPLQAQRLPANFSVRKIAGPNLLHADMDRLALAVSHQETCDCTCGSGSADNNCFGIRRDGRFAHYLTKAESFRDFKRIWTHSYGGIFPTIEHAKRYSGNDRAQSWLANVTVFYGAAGK